MPRKPRVAPGGQVFHVWNGSVGRMKMFKRDADYEAFEGILLEALERVPLRVLSYCILPSHWNFVVWPKRDGELSGFFRWLALTHAMRWRASRRTIGYGHLYQGRFKSFIIQRNEHLLAICRHVERGGVDASLVRRAEQWHWGSLWVRQQGNKEQREMLSEWPVERPRNWVDLVNQPLSESELERVKISINRERPFGDDRWTLQTARKLGMEHTVRPRGRPRKASAAAS